MKELIADPRVGVAVASMTTGAGTVLDWIPDGIGKLATLVGIGLSILIACVQNVKFKKELLELEIMRRKEDERRNAGKQLRRSED